MCDWERRKGLAPLSRATLLWEGGAAEAPEIVPRVCGFRDASLEYMSRSVQVCGQKVVGRGSALLLLLLLLLLLQKLRLFKAHQRILKLSICILKTSRATWQYPFLRERD